MWSMERLIWKCSVITDFMGMDDSNMTEILTESAKYDRKARWGWYTRQAPRAGTNICWQTSMRYLESWSYERVLRSCTDRVLWYLGEQYIVGNFRWLDEINYSSSDLL